MVKERNRNLDLLRIVSMFMVVVLHSVGHGGLNDITPAYGSANWYLSQTIFALCLVCVNCFVLISGYFLCTSEFKLKKWISSWGQALFYSVGIYLLLACAISGETVFSIKELIKCGMVFTMKQYWFVTAYLLLYAAFPFLNAMIRGMNKQQHLMCCLVSLGLFSILSNLVYISDFGGVNGGSSFLFFCILYLIAAYFRLYVPERVTHQKWMLPGYIICSLIICCERFAAYTITPHIFGSVKLSSLFYSYNSVMVVPACLFLLQFFRGLHIHGKLVSKVIGFVSPLTFAVYLIHDNPTMRPVLWDWIDLPSKAESPLLIVWVLLTAVCVFTVCCMVEVVRKWIFKKLHIAGALNRICDNIQDRVSIRLHLP